MELVLKKTEAKIKVREIDARINYDRRQVEAQDRTNAGETDNGNY